MTPAPALWRGAVDARDAMASAFVDEARLLAERGEAGRTAFYRMHLRYALRWASPILAGFAAAEGVRLLDLVDAMVPPPEWPDANVPMPRGLVRRHLVDLGSRPSLKSLGGDRAFSRRLAFGGTLVRPPSSEGGVFGVWVAGDTLDACMDFGSARLLLSGSEGVLRLPGAVPQTLLEAMPGRRLDAAVSHPLLDGAGHVVRRVLRFAGGGRSGEVVALAFSCGLEPLDLVNGIY